MRSATLIALIAASALAAPPAVAQGPRNQHRPVWSPDGAELVFMSDRTLDWELYTMHLDGSGLTRLTSHLGWDGYASLSGDGGAIAYDRRDDAFVIVVRDLASGREQLLVSEEGFAGSARWLPGDRELVFVSSRDGNRNIVRIQRDGSGRRNVTDTPEDEHDPAPSPDGRRLLMAVNLGDRGSALDLMELDGGVRTRLVTSSGYLYGTAWSPDGRWITFNTDEDGDQEIFRMRPDGTERTRLTDNDVADHQASWSPDGSLLLFTSERNGREEIFLMDPDGGHVVRVATD